ncbi:MAG: hypothetical protein ABII12_12315 [Planctomycetota bacterium]
MCYNCAAMIWIEHIASAPVASSAGGSLQDTVSFPRAMKPQIIRAAMGLRRHMTGLSRIEDQDERSA